MASQPGLTNRVALTNAVILRSMNGPESTHIVGFRIDGGGPAAVRGVFMKGGASLIGFTVTNGSTLAKFWQRSGLCGWRWSLLRERHCLQLLDRSNTAGYGGGGFMSPLVERDSCTGVGYSTMWLAPLRQGWVAGRCAGPFTDAPWLAIPPLTAAAERSVPRCTTVSWSPTRLPGGEGAPVGAPSRIVWCSATRPPRAATRAGGPFDHAARLRGLRQHGRQRRRAVRGHRV